jgi:hypothetical protein
LEEVLVKRELLVPLLLIVGVSMLITPISAQEYEVLPFELESDGYGKMKMGEKWGFWPIYCRGRAEFEYYIDTLFMDTDVDLYISGRCCSAWAYWSNIYFNDLEMEACGPIFTFKLPGPNWDTNGFEVGGARVVLFVGSGVPDYMDIPGPGLEDNDACGLVVVYGCGYFYIGHIDFIEWNYI